jgi:hypothetical protein
MQLKRLKIKRLINRETIYNKEMYLEDFMQRKIQTVKGA